MLSKLHVKIPGGMTARILCSALLCLIAVFTVSLAYAQDDAPGSKDYPGISRMPGYYINEYQDMPFDSFTFKVMEKGQAKEVPVEGHKIYFRYNLKEGATMPSPLQVLRNYEKAATATGGKVLRENTEDREATILLSKGGNEIWMDLGVCNVPSGVCIMLTLIEKQGMKQDVVIDADAMGGALKDKGSVAIYGIYFDTGKSELKPESNPAITEIAKLLKQNPALKVFIVGHTDMVGDYAVNIKLSQARAQAVIDNLVNKYQIAAARLLPFGAGPCAPVASNKGDEGRAKNRRVELVEIATK